MVIEVLIGTALAVVALALLSLLRRERIRGEASETQPVLVGFYRGCAFVLIAYVALVVITAAIRASTYRPF